MEDTFVKTIVDRMSGCAREHGLELTLYSESRRSFVIKVADDDVVSRHEFTRVGRFSTDDDCHEMVRLEGEGWVMSAVPALMFVAIYQRRI